jgi:hypothetical protein
VTVVEIAVAVITTGPAYLTVFLTLRKDVRERVPACEACTERFACGRSERSSGESRAEDPGGVWALAA